MNELRVIHTKNYKAECNQHYTYDIETVLNEIGEKYFLSTIFGNSMKNAGIHSGDIVVIRRTEKASDGDIVLCSVNGKHLIKRIYFRDSIELHSDNSDYGIMLPGDGELYICGVATHVIKGLK